MTLHKNLAIQTALMGDWEMAIAINEKILKADPLDIETLNRLAFAYTVIGRVKDAKQAYQKVLEIDVFNPIALKNLKRLGEVNPQKVSHAPQIVNNIFLEETGKTKIVTLINTAPPTIIQTLQLGQMLMTCIKRLKIFVLDDSGIYIGMLPDNIGIRLIKFLNGGNTYEVCVKAFEHHNVTVFIREKKRSAKFKNVPTFACIDGNSHLDFKRESTAKSSRHA